MVAGELTELAPTDSRLLRTGMVAGDSQSRPYGFEDIEAGAVAGDSQSRPYGIEDIEDWDGGGRAKARPYGLEVIGAGMVAGEPRLAPTDSRLLGLGWWRASQDSPLRIGGYWGWDGGGRLTESRLRIGGYWGWEVAGDSQSRPYGLIRGAGPPLQILRLGRRLAI